MNIFSTIYDKPCTPFSSNETDKINCIRIKLEKNQISMKNSKKTLTYFERCISTW